jgi:HEAT repeat protein
VKEMNVDEIQRLVELTLVGGTKSEKSAAQLASIGMKAIPAVIDALRTKSKDTTQVLSKVLLLIHHPDMAQVLLNLINEEKSDLALTAFWALKLLKDPRTLQPLSSYLLDSTKHDTRRSLAAEVIGELGDPQAASILLEVVNGILRKPDVTPVLKGRPLSQDVEIDEGILRVVIAISVALAKLGNHEMAPVVISLLHYRSSNVYSDAEVIRTQAAGALKYVVGLGVFSALQGALRDDYDEVRLKAIDAMFYLGVKEAVNELILSLNDASSMVSELALIRLGDLSGEIFKNDMSVAELKVWWKRHEKKYNTGVCYRLGKPIWLPDVIALLKQAHLRDQIVRELQIITGFDFGYNPHISAKKQKNLLKQAQAWWDRKGHHFESGSLYKYGHKQDIYSLLYQA